MNDDLERLAGTETAVWKTLENGVRDPTSPARTIALATEALTGGGAVRMVVLRAVDRETKRLTFYTHRASSKVAELDSNPQAEALVWDANRQFQIRLTGKVEIQDGPREIWDKFGPGTRRNYAAEPLPATPLSDPGEMEPTPDPHAFTVLTLHVDSFETLWLNKDVQRRARFTNGGAEWIAP